MNQFDFIKMKKENQKISMITCYDTWSAKIVSESDINCILVGDSLGMVMHGESNTLNVSTQLMALHTKAVVKGAQDKFIVADLPFLSYRKNLTETMNAVEAVMKAGANAVKLEGASGNIEAIKHIVESGVPVMGHLGLTPQSINGLGGFKVQGKSLESQEKILSEAKALQEAGCFAIVLECIPEKLSKIISQNLEIPTIGIGAGAAVDGQVLVMQDMLGMDPSFKPKFLKHYLKGKELLLGAFNTYHQEVQEKSFPTEKETY